jgi:hypothetical protein
MSTTTEPNTSGSDEIVLTISTIATLKRKRIKIDDEFYEILNRKEFGLKQQAWLNRAAEKIRVLFRNINDGNEKAARDAINKFIQKVMPGLPHSLLMSEGFSDYDKLSIVNVFMEDVTGGPKTASSSGDEGDDEGELEGDEE